MAGDPNDTPNHYDSFFQPDNTAYLVADEHSSPSPMGYYARLDRSGVAHAEGMEMTGWQVHALMCCRCMHESHQPLGAQGS